MEHVFGRRRRARSRSDVPAAPDPTPEGAPARPSTSTALGGRYELGRVLGQGGEASVHLARDLLLGREVAVKLFRGGVVSPTEEHLQRIETRVIAALNHYALTTLFDAGIDQGDARDPRIYLVMEYVAGESLKERLRRGRMEVSEACWMGFDLAEGLDHLHQSGFLHRDVKPANVLISGLRSVRPVVAKLTDFGIAAAIGEPDFGEFTVGTAAYLSPEQVEGHDAGTASDIYSLGIVLLEAMTGWVEFPGGVEESAFERLVRDPRIPDDVPAPVASVLRRMTTRRPEDRIDLHQVAVELQQYLADDLLRRRGLATAATSQAAALPDVRALVPVGRFDALVRLAARALDATALLLVVEDDDGVAVPAASGWTGGPEEALALLRSGEDGSPDTTVLVQPVAMQDGAVVGSLVAVGSGTDDVVAVLRDTAALIAQDVALRQAARRALFRVE